MKVVHVTNVPPTGIAGRLCDLMGLCDRHVTSPQPFLVSQPFCNRPTTVLQPCEVTQRCTTPVGGTHVADHPQQPRSTSPHIYEKASPSIALASSAALDQIMMLCKNECLPCWHFDVENTAMIICWPTRGNYRALALTPSIFTHNPCIFLYSRSLSPTYCSHAC